MKPLGGKPKREYEMSEKERLLNQLRKANNEVENIKAELQHVRVERASYYAAHNMLSYLMGQEVFISTDEGMKYLKGDDLYTYCREKLTEADLERHAGYETINVGFKGFANQAINEIIRDEVDKLSHTLDTYTYQTKGRAIYDPRSKSKKEGS